MTKLTIALASVVLCGASAVLAIEPLPPVGAQREVIATPQAVPGLRFVSQGYAGPSYMTRTGNIDGGDGAYNGCPEPCPSCLCPNVCADWTLMPWYGPWPAPRVHRGYRPNSYGGYYSGF